MTSKTAWVASTTLILVSVGVSVFSIFTAAHEEILERKLEEQRASFMDVNLRDAQDLVVPPFGTTTTFPVDPQDAYFIFNGRVIFTPPLKGKKPASQLGFSTAYGASSRLIQDQELLDFLANEILSFRKTYGLFAYDIESVELRYWSGQPFCSKLHGSKGNYRMVLDRRQYGGPTIRSVAHEVTHLADPFLFSWYMEGLADLRGDEALVSSGLDRFGALALQVHLHSPPYTAALTLMQQLDLIVGRMGIIDLVKTTKPTSWVGKQPKPGEKWATPLCVDIDSWLASLSRSERQTCLKIIRQEGTKVMKLGLGVHPQLGIQLPK
ncbi:MAG: hypothetical protein ACI97A_000749 [Planctomycetota bacterium]|jgi:hypothetical protein